MLFEISNLYTHGEQCRTPSALCVPYLTALRAVAPEISSDEMKVWQVLRSAACIEGGRQ